MAAWEFHRFEMKIGGLWRDLTARLDPGTPVRIGPIGRPAEGSGGPFADTVATSMQFALRNTDHALTPGNPLSPYYPDLEPIVEVRLVETVDGQPYTLFYGDGEFPEIENYVVASTTAPREQVISMSAVDRAARLDRAGPFLSNIGEWVKREGGTQLLAYYPLGETSGDTVYNAAPTTQPILTRRVYITGNSAGRDFPELLVLGGGDSVPADDLPGSAEFAPGTNPAGTINESSATLEASGLSGVTIDAGDTLSLVGWVKIPRDPINGLVAPFQLGAAAGSTDFVRFVIEGDRTASMEALGNSFAWQIDFAGGKIPADAWTLIAVKLTLPSTGELWINSTRFAGTSTGVAPASLALSRIYLGLLGYEGNVSHVQVWCGNGSDPYTYARHLEQLEIGWHGYARQRADERIAMVADYAGLSTSDLDLDESLTILGPARLAGARPGEVIRAAAATEGGTYLATGAGKLELQSRARRYNPPVAATIPLTWLTQPLRMRATTLLNSASVDQDGVTGRARDATSIARYRADAGYTDTIDSAVDADPANRAARVVDWFRTPRMHLTELQFDLLPLSTAARHTVLARWVGERVDISGLPANAPEGVGAVHIEGITHTISPQVRRTSWAVSRVLGDTPGVADTWAQVGTSVVSSSTLVPY